MNYAKYFFTCNIGKYRLKLKTDQLQTNYRPILEIFSQKSVLQTESKNTDRIDNTARERHYLVEAFLGSYLLSYLKFCLNIRRVRASTTRDKIFLTKLKNQDFFSNILKYRSA